MLLRQNSPLEKGWEGSPELSHKAAQGLEATTGLQWDVQTLTIGGDAIEEIFLPFIQARGNSAAISVTLCYYLDLGISCAAGAASWQRKHRPIRSIFINPSAKLPDKYMSKKSV